MIDRRHFLALSSVSLAAGCASAGPEGQVNSPGGEAITEGRYYPPVTQVSPLGRQVIHDRATYIEQYKYENWNPRREWQDDAVLWQDFSNRWGQGILPIQRRPMRILQDLYLLGPDDYHQCIYLFDTGAGLLLVDPSYTRFQEMIEIQIRQLGYRLEDVKWVLLTHMHWDHSQSAAMWEKRGAKVYVHTADADYITGRIDPGGPEIVQKVVSPVTFDDGARLNFGALELRAVHTPGHTPGSACHSFTWHGSPALLSGDIVLDWGRHAWMGADYCNWDQYLASLWKLHDDKDAALWQVLLPGHGTLNLEGAGESLYAVIRIVSEIMRRRRSGSDIDWLNPYEVFWRLKNEGGGELEVLRS